MDNADKIENTDAETGKAAEKENAKLTHREVALFLGEDLKKFRTEAVKPYNLEEEYAKTANHHSKKVWMMLLLCFVLVGIGTLAATMAVSSSNQKIAVKIDTFNDLNLRALLDMVDRTQNAYDEAVRNKESYEAELQNELNIASQKKENDLFTLNSVSIFSSRKRTEERRQAIETDYNQAVRDAHAKYDSKIAKSENEISTFKAQLDAFDSNMLSQAKRAESAIDSQRELNDIKSQQQLEKYEQKIKELRLELINQQLKAQEEQRKAVEEVQQIYQAEIVSLMKNHKDFLEKMIIHNGGDGIVTEITDDKKLRVYIADEKLKAFASGADVTCTISNYRSENKMTKENGNFFIVKPSELFLSAKPGDSVTLFIKQSEKQN